MNRDVSEQCTSFYQPLIVCMYFVCVRRGKQRIASVSAHYEIAKW